MREWLSAADIAELRLPGLPCTKRGVAILAQREQWELRSDLVRNRPGRGGGIEYHWSLLPEAARAALIDQAPAPARAETAAGLAALPELKTWQRDVAGARLEVLQEIARRAAGARTGIERAIAEILIEARTGILPGPVADAIRAANARIGESRRLSARTVRRWRTLYEVHGIAGLVPSTAARPPEPPAWSAALLRLWRNPAKPSLSDVLRRLPGELPAGCPVPGYHAARRYLKSLPAAERERGRRGPNGLKAILPFVRRSTDHLWPLDVIVMDGYSAKWDVRHPESPTRCRPEMTAILDVATRRCIGWGVSYAESAEAVRQALKRAVTTAGLPAMLYTDRGAAYKAGQSSDEVIGLFRRLGITHTMARPRNPQARGMMEASHPSIWEIEARQLPAFAGKSMDGEARTLIARKIDQSLKLHGRSNLLMDWSQMADWAEAAAAAYNARPHTALPMTIDEATGALRHQSPDEAWAAAIAEGWTPRLMTPEEASLAFLPRRVATVSRGEVRLFGNIYFSADLADHHGRKVLLAYDPDHAGEVAVHDMDERLIAIAEFEANKRPYFDQAVVDRARSASEAAAEARAKGRLKRLEDKRAAVLSEWKGGPVTIESAADEPARPLPDPIDLAEARERINAALGRTAAPAPAAPPPGERPVFTDDLSFLRWLLDNPGEALERDWSYLNGEMAKSPSLRMLIETEFRRRGMAPPALMEIAV